MSSAQRPNILFIIPHDLGDFLGCYGHASIASPRLDLLAANGVRFQNCFTTAPECTPSRGGMMTGLYPHQNGLMGLSNFGWSLRVPHVAARLRDRGYTTHQFGFQHETDDPVETLGYQFVHHVPGNKATDVCAEVSSFLNTQEAEQQSPWFAYVGFFDVHRRWCAAGDSRFDPSDVEVPSWLPDHPVVRADLARFHQDIETMDMAVGNLLDALRDSALAEDTLVIFTTDHGAAFPGAKATLYDPGVHVPLIMHWPGHIEGGHVHDCLISNLDITPTLLEMAGGRVPSGLSGRSFLPLLEGNPYEVRTEACGALFYDVAYDPMHYVRTSSHKYIRSFAATEADAVGADSETLSTFAAGRWVRVDDFDVLTSPSWQALAPPDGSPKPGREELYDLRTDPDERHNLVHDPDSSNVLKDMRSRLQRMMEQTASPLLNSHVPPPGKQRAILKSYCPDSPPFLEEAARRRDLL